MAFVDLNIIKNKTKEALELLEQYNYEFTRWMEFASYEARQGFPIFGYGNRWR